MLKCKFKSTTKAVGLVSSYPHNKRVRIGGTPNGVKNLNADECVGNQTDYGPFITTGFVYSVNCLGKVSIKILCDTGSSESFILDSKLNFSSESSTGNSILIQGIGLEIFSAPLHRIQLQSELVNGEVEIAL